MSKRLPAAVAAQAELTDAMDAEIASAAPAPEPEPVLAAPAPEPVAPPATPAPTEDSWHHKFLTLQGKYNSETATLRTQVETLQADMQALKDAKPTPTPEPAAATPKAKLVTEADTDAFGNDLIDLMRRVALEQDDGAKAALQAEIETLKAQLPTLSERVDTVTRVTAADKRADYFVELAKQCSTWKQVNESDAFKGWISLPDAFSGVVRNDTLQAAYEAFDHDRTAVIFNAFLQETGTPAPAADPEPAPTPPAAELAAQVSPAGGKAASEITPDDGKKIWTAEEVQNFFNDGARGAYRGREADQKRIDAEIDQALIENRVRA